MTRIDDDFPAVGRLEADLRQDLISAEDESRLPKRLRGGRRLARPLAVLGALAVIPATFAVAELRSDIPENEPVAIDRDFEPVLCPDGKPLILDRPVRKPTCPDGSVPEDLAGVLELSTGAGDSPPEVVDSPPPMSNRSASEQSQRARPLK